MENRYRRRNVSHDDLEVVRRLHAAVLKAAGG